jgi:hypothetical protein
MTRWLDSELEPDRPTGSQKGSTTPLYSFPSALVRFVVVGAIVGAAFIVGVRL